MTIINYDDLAQLREKYVSKRIVYCSGTFDLTHAGHVLFFEDCKNMGDLLVVGVGDDVTIRKYKGLSRPIVNEHMRLKMVDSLKPVDFTLADRPSTVGENAFFSPLDLIFERLRPDVYVVNEDIADAAQREEVCKRHNVRMVILKRWCPPEFEEISTTSLIKKLKS